MLEFEIDYLKELQLEAKEVDPVRAAQIGLVLAFVEGEASVLEKILLDYEIVIPQPQIQYGPGTPGLGEAFRNYLAQTPDLSEIVRKPHEPQS